MEKLKSFLEKNQIKKILDVGTGRGNFIALLDFLYKDYEKIVGIDILDGSIQLARKHFENNDKIEFITKDINDSDFSNEHFDLVCLSNSLHHLEDKVETIKNMEKLVKPGGYIIYNEMMKDNLNAKQESHKLLHHFSAKIDRELGRFHDDTFNRLDIVKEIENTSSLRVIEYWDMLVEEQEPTEAEIKSFAMTVDHLLNQIKDENIKNNYLEEANEIKSYILNNGLQGCTQLLTITKKE